MRCRCRPRLEGLPQHLDGLDGIGQALQVRGPSERHWWSVAPAGHQPHHVGGQDLAALAGGAEPGRLDDRVAEVVVVLSADLAAAQPDPQAHRVVTAAVVPARRPAAWPPHTPRRPRPRRTPP